MADNLSALDKLTRALSPTGSSFDGPHTLNVIPIAGGAPNANTSDLSVWDKLTRALTPASADVNGPYTLSMTLGQAPIGGSYAFTGTAPASQVGAGTSAGTFWSVTAPNGGASSGAAGGSGASVAVTTGTAGASFSGGANGGDYTINLGGGTGTGRTGRLLINSTVSGTQNQGAQVVYNSLIFSGLTADYTFDGTAAIENRTTTDTSAFSYTARIRTDLTQFYIKTTGASTIDRIEVAPHLCLVDVAAAGTNTTYGYAVSGELLHSSDSYTVTLWQSVFGTTQLLANGNVGTGYGTYGNCINTAGKTGTYTVSATGAYGAVQNNNGSTMPLAYGAQATVSNTAAGIITTAIGYSALLTQTGAGSITTGYGYRDLGPTITAGQITTMYGMYIAAQFNTTGNTSVTGGFASTGLAVVTPTQGGNTSATNTNTAISISGNGGTAGGGGTVTNYAIFSTSTAQSRLDGALVLNSPTHVIGTTSLDTSKAFYAHGTGTVGVSQSAFASVWTFGSDATTQGAVFDATLRTAAAVYTMGIGAAFWARPPTYGASSVVSAAYGLYVENQGAANATISYGVRILNQSGAGSTWSLVVGTGNSSFAGAVAIGSTTAPTASSITMATLWDILPTAGATSQVTGFIYVASNAGAPTGVPTNDAAGRAALYYDKTNHFLYVYDSGWKKSTVYA